MSYIELIKENVKNYRESLDNEAKKWWDDNLYFIIDNIVKESQTSTGSIYVRYPYKGDMEYITKYIPQELSNYFKVHVQPGGDVVVKGDIR